MSESLGSPGGEYDLSDKYVGLLADKQEAVGRVCYWRHALVSKEWERVQEGASRCLSKDAAERSLVHWQNVIEDLDVQISATEMAWYDATGLTGSVPKAPKKVSVAVGTDEDEPLAKRVKVAAMMAVYHPTVPDVPDEPDLSCGELMDATDAARQLELELAAAADEADRLEDGLTAMYGNVDEWIMEAVDAERMMGLPASPAGSADGLLPVEVEPIDLTDV